MPAGPEVSGQVWQSFQHYCVHQVMFLLHLIIRRQKSNCLINGAWIIPCMYKCQYFVTAFYLLTGSQSWRHHVYPENNALLGYSGPKEYVDKYWSVLIIFMDYLRGVGTSNLKLTTVLAYKWLFCTNLHH